MQNTGYHRYSCVDLKGTGGAGNRVKGGGGELAIFLFLILITGFSWLVYITFIYHKKELQIFLFVYCNARQG